MNDLHTALMSGAKEDENASVLQPAQVINNEERAHVGVPIMTIKELDAYDQRIEGKDRSPPKKGVID